MDQVLANVGLHHLFLGELNHPQFRPSSNNQYHNLLQRNMRQNSGTGSDWGQIYSLLQGRDSLPSHRAPGKRPSQEAGSSAVSAQPKKTHLRPRQCWLWHSSCGGRCLAFSTYWHASWESEEMLAGHSSFWGICRNNKTHTNSKHNLFRYRGNLYHPLHPVKTL